MNATFGGVAVAITDLSIKGARFTHQAPIEAGSKSALKLTLEGRPAPVSLDSMVVWTQVEESEREGKRFVSGIRTYASPETVSRLLRELHEQQRSSRIEEFRAIDRFIIASPIEGEFSPVGRAQIHDLSARGARIESSSPLPKDAAGMLRFGVPRSNLEIALQARVVWCHVKRLGSPTENRYRMGLSIQEKPELLRSAIGHLCELSLATLDTHSLELKLKIMAARARKDASEYQAILASGIPPEQFLLVESVREELRANPEEAIHWHQKARGGAKDAELRKIAGPIADHREAMAVWEYLDRTIDPSVIARSFAFKGYTVAEAQDEIFRLHTLVEASKLINRSISPDALFDSILTVARKNLDVERGTLYFVDDRRGEIWSKIASGLESSEIRLPVGKGLAGSVAATGDMIILHDAYADPRFDRSSDDKSGFQTRSMLCVPIKNRDGKVVGVLQLLNKKSGKFGTKDVDFLESLSEHMAIAMENATLHMAELERNRMEQELKLGREIQSSLLPKPPSDVARTEIAAASNSCYEVGGDYYDFIELPTGELGLAIGDVSGKGVSAALVMSSLQASLRMAAPIEDDLPRLVARLNGLLYRMTRGRKYVTFFFGRYDPATGVLRYVNAGHNPPYLCRDGTMSRLESTGRPIGLMPDIAFEEASVEMPVGSLLFLYTDGMTEAENPREEEYGNERWEALLRQTAGIPLGTMTARLLDTITAFEAGAPPCDDKTVVVIKRV